jgi:Cu/Ag efflux protein CusF
MLIWLLVISSAMLSVSCGKQPQAGNTPEPTPESAAAPPIPWKTIEPPTQIGPSQGPQNPQQPSVVRTFSGTGVVRLVNRKEGWLEIDHEAIEGLMPAMQMEWSVKDRAMLKSVRAGDKVNFTIEDNNGSEVIIELKKAPPAR